MIPFSRVKLDFVNEVEIFVDAQRSPRATGYPAGSAASVKPSLSGVTGLTAWRSYTRIQPLKLPTLPNAIQYFFQSENSQAPSA